MYVGVLAEFICILRGCLGRLDSMKMKCPQQIGQDSWARQQKHGVCLDIPLRRVEAFSEVVSERVVERIGPVCQLLLLVLNVIVSRNEIIVGRPEGGPSSSAAERH